MKLSKYFKDKNLFKQIGVSFVFKFIAIILSFLLVRLILNYLGAELYGVWVVLLSFINWVVFFDMGIANGVKNKVAESLVLNDFKSARQYISTGYITILVLVIFFFTISTIVINLIDWNVVFNIEFFDENKLRNAVFIIVVSILINFVLSLINQVFIAVKKSSLVVLNQVLFQSLTVLIVLLISRWLEADLKFIALAYSGSLIFSNVVISVWFYSINKNISPSFYEVKLDKIKDIFSLGIKFFILQFLTLIILTTDKFLIIKLVGPSAVASYDVLYKYFSVLYIAHGLINTPLWAMYTDKYKKKDYKWIFNTIKRLNGLMLLYILLVLIMVVFGGYFTKLLIGKQHLGLSNTNFILVGAMILMLIWYSIYAFFSNGTENTKIQMISGVLGAIINIPLSVFFVNYLDMGLNGVVLATICSLGIYGLLGPIDTFLILNKMKRNKCKN